MFFPRVLCSRVDDRVWPTCPSRNPSVHLVCLISSRITVALMFFVQRPSALHPYLYLRQGWRGGAAVPLDHLPWHLPPGDNNRPAIGGEGGESGRRKDAQIFLLVIIARHLELMHNESCSFSSGGFKFHLSVSNWRVVINNSSLDSERKEKDKKYFYYCQLLSVIMCCRAPWGGCGTRFLMRTILFWVCAQSSQSAPDLHWTLDVFPLMVSSMTPDPSTRFHV